jgi:thiol-disulfide isomerase/thioredoxin
MRAIFLFVLVLAIVSLEEAYCQPEINTRFDLTGQIIGRDTGAVMFWYIDESNIQVDDTFRLVKGSFHFSGTVNRVCEAFLWTDLKNRNYDDPSVIRFLLEPGRLFVSHNIADPLNNQIRGSASEMEKEEWCRQNADLLSAKEAIYQSILSLDKAQMNNPGSEKEEQLKSLSASYDSVGDEIKKLDVVYLKNHPNSYLSAYLLFRHVRKLPIDSAQVYYTGLSPNSKRSVLGRRILSYLYPLTNDLAFRKENPLISQEFDEKISRISSFYDLNLFDSTGNRFDMSLYKGKYLVVDFWASWCKPCLANIPALIKMTKNYDSDSIKFISISLDDNLNDWKGAIIKHHFTGIQLTDSNSFNSMSAIYCKVLWVPHYLLVDRSGKIINYDAPQALDPELAVTLDKLVDR